MNSHVMRWGTGLIAGPLIFAIVIFSSEIIYFFFILALIQIAVWEYNKLVFNKQGFVFEKGEVIIFAILIPLAVYFDANASLAVMLTFCIFLTFLLFLYQIKTPEIDISRIGKVILGIMYIPLLLSNLILLRNLADGILWVIFT